MLCADGLGLGTNRAVKSEAQYEALYEEPGFPMGRRSRANQLCRVADVGWRGAALASLRLPLTRLQFSPVLLACRFTSLSSPQYLSAALTQRCCPLTLFVALPSTNFILAILENCMSSSNQRK